MLLTIEKLIYGGDGLARLPADDRGPGKAVFIPFVLAGEKIEALLIEQKSGFARAQTQTVVEPSPLRVQPQCPYFVRCGGCHYQHANYTHQLEIKTEILRENLRRIAKLELQSEISVHPSPPWNYRNRSRLQVRTQPDFVAGYFKLSSHEVLPVETCPISSPLINRGIATLWEIGRAGEVPEGVREVEFFANADETQMLVEFSCGPDSKTSNLKAFAEEWRTVQPEILGVAAFREARPGAQLTANVDLLSGESYLTYQTQHSPYRVSVGAFFQTNRHLSNELVKIVTEGYSGNLALDLYAGVGLFSTALACNFHHIVSVESSHRALPDLQYNLPPNGEAVQATTEQYLSQHYGTDRPGKTSAKQKPDLVVVDPPRSGLGESVARSVANLGAPRLTYVSCDPATLARDLVHLLAAGYRVEQAHLVDLFPHTYHLETVLQLVR